MPLSGLNPFVTLSALKFLVTPAEYLEFVARCSTRLGFFELPDDFETDTDICKVIPRYRIAICPFCGHEYSALINTYGLDGWDTHTSTLPNRKMDTQDLIYDLQNTTKCPHYVETQVFLNLNGFLPEEITSLSIPSGDVPIVTPYFLFDDLPSAVVLHSLPICRPWREEFQPRYIAYFMVYYAEDCDLAWKKRQLAPDYQAWAKSDGDGDYFVYLYDSGSWDHPEWRDLERFSQQGKLFWLSPETLELTSYQNSLTPFPYRQIAGFMRDYDYDRGALQLRYGNIPFTINRRRSFPDTQISPSDATKSSSLSSTTESIIGLAIIILLPLLCVAVAVLTFILFQVRR